MGKVYVVIEQDYEDITRVRVFHDKETADSLAAIYHTQSSECEILDSFDDRKVIHHVLEWYPFVPEGHPDLQRLTAGGSQVTWYKNEYGGTPEQIQCMERSRNKAWISHDSQVTKKGLPPILPGREAPPDYTADLTKVHIESTVSLADAIARAIALVKKETGKEVAFPLIPKMQEALDNE